MVKKEKREWVGFKKSNWGFCFSLSVKAMRNFWPFLATNWAVSLITSISNIVKLVGGSTVNLSAGGAFTSTLNSFFISFFCWITGAAICSGSGLASSLSGSSIQNYYQYLSQKEKKFVIEMIFQYKNRQNFHFSKAKKLFFLYEKFSSFLYIKIQKE